MISRIIEVLHVIVALIQKLVRKAEARKDQEEIDQLYADPAGWFGEHFNADGSLRDTAATNQATETEDHD
jgi:hypothetical protein